MKYYIVLLCLLLSGDLTASLRQSFLAAEKGEYDRAYTLLSEKQVESPFDPVVNYNLGFALHKQKKFDAAKGAYRRAAEHAKHVDLKEQAHFNTGVSACSQALTLLGGEDFDKRKVKDEDLALAEQELKESIAAYRSVIESNNEHKYARVNKQYAEKLLARVQKKQEQNKHDQHDKKHEDAPQKDEQQKRDQQKNDQREGDKQKQDADAQKDSSQDNNQQHKQSGSGDESRQSTSKSNHDNHDAQRDAQKEQDRRGENSSDGQSKVQRDDQKQQSRGADEYDTKQHDEKHEPEASQQEGEPQQKDIGSGHSDKGDKQAGDAAGGGLPGREKEKRGFLADEDKRENDQGARSMRSLLRFLESRESEMHRMQLKKRSARGNQAQTKKNW